MDSAYVSLQGPEETGKAYGLRKDTILATLLQAEPNEKGMRIEKDWPDTNWSMVWGNLWAPPVPDSTKVAWYRVIHDIVPTRERLHAIRLAQTDLCPTCHVKDTLTHRITGCGEGNVQWQWTRKRLAVMLRTVPAVDTRRVAVSPAIPLLACAKA
jgi:hypothetical protein